MAAAAPAGAATSPYYVSLSEMVAHDNNLLRLGNGQVAPEGYSRADTSYVTQLQAGLDQPFGRQRAAVNLSLRDTRYQGNTTFNNQGYTGSAVLDWSTIERISGSLSATANRGLSGFNTYEIGLLNQKNYEDSEGLNASVSVGMVTQYSLEAAFGERRVTNTLQQQALQSRNFKQDNGSLGVRWRPSSATNIGLFVRQTQGRYPKFRVDADGNNVPDRYKQDGVELTANLTPTGASTLDLRIGQSRTRYDLNEARNFTGVTGQLAWSWQVTGKSRLGAKLTRDTGQDSYAVTVFSNVPGSSDNSRLVNAFRIDSAYEVSPKLIFFAGWQLAQRNVVQTINNPLLPLNAEGKDRTSTLTLSVRWTPLRSVGLGCELIHDDRKGSGALTSTLSSAALSCYAQLQLQP